MEIYTKANSKIKSNRGTGLINILAGMSMKAIGKTMSSKAMGYSDLQTAQFIRESSPAASLTEKENILIKLSNSMIFENIADLGQTASLLDMAKQFITMEMCMKEIF